MKATDRLINKNPMSCLKINKKNAYHLAGQALGMYKWNKQKKLPPMHFQIVINKKNKNKALQDQLTPTSERYEGVIEGGLLIQNPFLSYSQATHYFSRAQHGLYKKAVEADVINLLAGLLSEARYTAFCNNEIFIPDIHDFDALKLFGGNSGMSRINQYIKTCFANENEQNQNLQELIGKTFCLISKRGNWRAISKLANYLCWQNQSVIDYEAIILEICSNAQSMQDDEPSLHTKIEYQTETNFLIKPQLV